MILTEEYFEARSEAMKWLAQKPDKRNFAAGLRILVKSGYKPNVQKLLQKKGELPWTMEKLTSCLRDVVQVYYNPDDPRFDDVPDADMLNDKTGEKPAVDEQDGIANLAASPGFQSMPEVMQILIRNFADAYKQRAKLARQRYELGESNDEDVVNKRKTLGESIDKLTDYMDVLADGAWENIFTEKPSVFTAEEKRAWLDQMTEVTLGSDAFFPFSDNIERAHKSGVKYIAQPGGSVRDDLVIECCDKYDMVMAFTGIRLFHH